MADLFLDEGDFTDADFLSDAFETNPEPQQQQFIQQQQYEQQPSFYMDQNIQQQQQFAFNPLMFFTPPAQQTWLSNSLANAAAFMYAPTVAGGFGSPSSLSLTDSHSHSSLSPHQQQQFVPQQQQINQHQELSSNNSTGSMSVVSKDKTKKSPAKKKKKVSPTTKASNTSSSSSSNNSLSALSSGSDSDDKNRKKPRKRAQDEIEKDMERLTNLEKENELTEQQKEEKKKLRNRHTAKVSRDRKKKELEDLRNQNTDLQEELEKSKGKVKALEEQVTVLTLENINLKNRLDTSNVGDGMVVFNMNNHNHNNNGYIGHGNNTTNGSTSRMRSVVLLVGVLFLLGIVATLTGTYKYNSLPTSTSSKTNSVEAPKRMARGLLSINNSEIATPTRQQQTTTTKNAQIPKSLPNRAASSSAEHASNNQYSSPIPEPIFVENTMEMGETMDDDFNSDGMTSYDVFYPTKLKRHFSSFPQATTAAASHSSKQNSSEASHIRSYDNSTTAASPLHKQSKKKHSLTSQRHNNSKQISALVAPTILGKRIEEKRHKYEKAKVYVPAESILPDKNNELHMFCPYLYPLIAGVPDTGYEFNTKDFESRKASLKIHVPIQMVCNKTNTKVVRMAEIYAENLTLSEAFYEFQGSSGLSLQPVSTTPN